MGTFVILAGFLSVYCVAVFKKKKKNKARTLSLPCFVEDLNMQKHLFVLSQCKYLL